eukprot:scaffold436882_cov24-Prasinocladus_malaysianus.AAC.1
MARCNQRVSASAPSVLANKAWLFMWLTIQFHMRTIELGHWLSEMVHYNQLARKIVNNYLASTMLHDSANMDVYK